MHRSLTFVLLVVMVSTTCAEEAGEHAALGHLVRAMESLSSWVDAAEAQAEPDIRSSRYTCLRGDLSSVRQGIEMHINGPREVSSQSTPLCLNYLGLSSRPGVVVGEGELEPLARLAHAMLALEPLIKNAESEVNANTRIRFQYSWLRQDLIRVRSGIERLVNAPHTVPRAFAPLTGDHRR
jgi:RAQPRD family integrative conjugative element protein